MNLFPSIYPTVWECDFDRFQERDASRRGDPQINSYDPVDQCFARARWEVLTRAGYDALWDHWHLYATEDFSLFDFHLRKLRGVWVAVADGTSTIYTLPAKGVVTPVIKHDDLTAGTQPSLLVGTGAEGEDQIEYTAPSKPAAGVVITLDAADAYQKFEVNYGNTKWLGRFREGDVWRAEAEFIQKVVAE